MGDLRKVIMGRREMTKKNVLHEIEAGHPLTGEEKVSGAMLAPLTGTERTGGTEDRRDDGFCCVCFRLFGNTHSLSLRPLLLLGSLIFTALVNSLRGLLHDLIFLTIWTWKDFPDI